MDLETFMQDLERRAPGEKLFHQAVREALRDLIPVVEERADYRDARILERLTEPDRVIAFRVCWQDDAGEIRVSRGYRVQYNGAIGPYKGGLRFAPDVDLATFKFLGFEQTLKNSLTGLPLGGAKGGAVFDPRGRSDAEIMRFCQAFMNELHHHIGPDRDVPAGDIGVGAREIGYLFGQYRQLTHRFEGALTGKRIAFGGSAVRTEATGWGCVYFATHVLEQAGRAIDGLSCVISGAGNVALYAAQKLLERGARVIALSDSTGTVHDPDGLDEEKLAWLMELKQRRRGSLEEYAEEFGAEHRPDAKPWQIECDAAFPCATQNEIGEKDARQLVRSGCALVVEGANMPTTAEATAVLREAGILHAPGKAANAGGVAISGLEMTQNSLGRQWGDERVEEELEVIMRGIHERCVEHGEREGGVDYVRGANRSGFVKVADAMTSFGAV